VQLQEAARRGAGEHVGQAGGRLSTGIERSTRSDGSPVVTLTMGIEGYADRSVIFDGRLWARVNPVTWVGDYGGMVMVAGSLTGDVRLCGALGRALVRAALDEEERSEDPTPDLGLPVGADGRARKPLARP
jgi:hypothetical protein